MLLRVSYGEAAKPMPPFLVEERRRKLLFAPARKQKLPSREKLFADVYTLS
jgi:hypothetical protein